MMCIERDCGNRAGICAPCFDALREKLAAQAKLSEQTIDEKRALEARVVKMEAVMRPVRAFVQEIYREVTGPRFTDRGGWGEWASGILAVLDALEKNGGGK